MMLFYAARSLLNESMEGAGTYFGEVDGSDMANVEESERSREKTHGLTLSYIQPWSSEEYKTLRLPLACGFSVALLFVLWVCAQLPFVGCPYENVEVILVNVLPLSYPVIAFVAALELACKAVWVDKAVELGRNSYVALAVALVALAALAGMFYAGGAASRPDAVIAEAPQYGSETVDSAHVQFVWNARCAQCHGVDGRFNDKFIREYYPVPQKLDVARIDSLGLDSLVNVVLDGRVNMNPYRGRLTESEARALVVYMRSLAEAP
jgi:mono/diheme cytochrome c family protein